MKSNTYEPFITPTENFSKMTQEERQLYVLNIPMRDVEFPLLSEGHQYPEKNFIDFQGRENGRPIKLTTFRYKSRITPIKGVFIILHSCYTYTKYTAHYAEKLSDNGYEVVSYDMRGHGESQGSPQLNDYKELLNEAYTFMQRIQQLYKDIPMFVLGWGIPSLYLLYISLYYYQDIKIAGMIMASTLYKIPSGAKSFNTVGNVAQGYLNIEPTTTGIYKPNFDCFTKYKNISKILQQDPLNSHCQTEANSIMQLDALMNDVPYEYWDKMDTPPIVILHGECDKYGNGYNSYVFYSKIKTQDKEFWYYPQMNFAFFLEDQCSEIEKRTVKWLNRLTKRKSSII